MSPNEDAELRILLQLEMKRLQDDFLNHLPERALSIELAWNSAQNEENWQAFHLTIHGLRGTSLTLGFPQIGALAAALEEGLKLGWPFGKLCPLYEALQKELGEPTPPQPFSLD